MGSRDRLGIADRSDRLCHHARRRLVDRRPVGCFLSGKGGRASRIGRLTEAGTRPVTQGFRRGERSEWWVLLVGNTIGDDAAMVYGQVVGARRAQETLIGWPAARRSQGRRDARSGLPVDHRGKSSVPPVLIKPVVRRVVRAVTGHGNDVPFALECSRDQLGPNTSGPGPRGACPPSQ